MKIALASARVRDQDLAFNLTQMAKYLSMAKEQGADLVCFGEAQLQGFDSMTWDYETDRTMAVSCSSGMFQILAGWTRDSGVDLMFGFLEREGDAIYSSYALISRGEVLQKYRRISRGWKVFWKTDGHYREGNEVQVFQYRGRSCAVALCGDLWDSTDRFKLGEEILFWPVYVDYDPKEWKQKVRQEYAEKAAEVCRNVLMINPVDKDAKGGSCWFENGAVREALPMGEAGLLVVEI